MSKVVDGILKDLKNIPESLRKKMKGTDKNKLIRMSIPYVIVGYFCDKSAWMFRQVERDLFPRLMDTASRLGEAFANPLPSFNPMDLLFGVACGVGFRLIVYFKAKNAKKFRHGVEYGSARWGNAKDIEPYMDPVFENNIILTASERLMMSGRPSSPKYARNKNILVIGGSGSGKTRFFVKPNLMQMHSSYVVTDPRGTYSGMMLEGNLKEHCLMIQKQAEERMDLLTSQMAKSQGVNEALKASDQMKWVGLMNNIRASAEEIVLSELIYS